MDTQLNNTSNYGKVPPQATEVEKMVIGAIMLHKIIDQIPFLKAEMFYKESHQLIYKACLELKYNAEPIDIVTVAQKLKTQENLELVGGAYNLSELTNNVYGIQNIEYHARIIMQKWMQRELISIGLNLVDEMYDDTNDVYETLDEIQHNINNIASMFVTPYITIKDGVDMVVNKMEDNYANQQQTGMKTGIHEFDELTMGLQPGDLILIAGRTSRGKTLTALQLSYELSINQQYKGVYLSYEMTELQMAARLTSIATGINSKLLLNAVPSGKEFTTITEHRDKLNNGVLLLSKKKDKRSDLIRSIRQFVQKEKVQYVVVDYLQNIPFDDLNTPRAIGVGDIARSLQLLALELNIPIILLCQVKRKEAGWRKIRYDDLKESGDIENSADIVWAVDMPELDGIDEVTVYREHMSTQNAMLHGVLKGRNYGTTEFMTSVDLNSQRLLPYVPNNNIIDYNADKFIEDEPF